MRQRLAILVGLVVLLALSGRAFAHYNVFNGDIYDNTMHGHEHGDEFHGHAGNDTGYGRGFVDSLGGGHDNDYLYGDSGGDFLSGGDGDDYVHGNGQNDHVEGDAGDDSVLAGAWYDNVIQGGPGRTTWIPTMLRIRSWPAAERETSTGVSSTYLTSQRVVRGSSHRDLHLPASRTISR
jgi:Ca2+-binding RTX toxin-like protein